MQRIFIDGRAGFWLGFNLRGCTALLHRPAVANRIASSIFTRSMGPKTPVPVAGEASHVVLVQIVRPIAESYSRRESDSFPK